MCEQFRRGRLVREGQRQVYLQVGIGASHVREELARHNLGQERLVLEEGEIVSNAEHVQDL